MYAYVRTCRLPAEFEYQPHLETSTGPVVYDRRLKYVDHVEVMELGTKRN